MYEWLADATASGTVVTPNRRLARSLLREYERRMLDAGELAWRSPAILPWSGWIRHLQDSRAPRDGQAVWISGLQSRMLWEQCLEHSLREPAAGQLLNLSALARLAAEAWARVHDWQVPLDDVEKAARGLDQHLFARAARAYGNRLTEQNWIDDAGLPTLLASIGEDDLEISDSTITLAGFDRITPGANAVLSALSRRGIEIRHTPVGEAGPARFHAYENDAAELRAAGRWARNLLEENPQQVVAIVVNKLEQRAGQAARWVREGCTPGWQFGDPSVGAGVDVSFGQALAGYPAVGTGLLALRWLYNDISSAEVSMLLRSPLLGQVPLYGRTRLEIRLRDRPDRQWSIERLTAALRSSADAGDALDWLQRFEAVAELRSGAPRLADPPAWAAFADTVLERLGWPGAGPLDSGSFQLVNRWRSLLNEFSRLAPVSGAVGGREAMSRIGTMAGETLFQPERDGARVALMGPLEAAGLEFDALWIAGLGARDWPAAGTPSPLLSIELQRAHEMPDASPEDTAQFSQRILGRLRGGTSTCVMSYPVNIGDAEQLPSGMLADLDVTTGPADPGWHASTLVGLAASRAVTDRVPAVRDGEVVTGGSGTIGRYLSEPFSGFATGRLGIRRLRPFRAGISSIIRGNLLHDALAALYCDKPLQDDIRNWDEKSIAERIDNALSVAFRRYDRYADATLGQLMQLERRRASALLRQVIAFDLQRPSFRIVDVENQLDATIGDIALRLRVDRIEHDSAGGVVILDYKSGDPDRFLVHDSPRDFQLVVYAAAVDDTVTGLGLYRVDSKSVAVDGTGPAFGSDDNWDERLDEWTGIVIGACQGIARGDVRVNLQQGLADARDWSLLTRFPELRRDN